MYEHTQANIEIKIQIYMEYASANPDADAMCSSDLHLVLRENGIFVTSGLRHAKCITGEALQYARDI